MNNYINILSKPECSFINFVWKERVNKKYLLFGIGLSVVQFIFFKLLYPFPDFFSDSYSYIYAAYLHLDINIWPIGYSKFLSSIHSITYSDTALVAFQYFSMQLSALYFYFTILFLFNSTQWTRRVLFIFIFINPLTLYICNTINSDAIFAALSILWFTELIRIIQKPRLYQLFTQAILLFLCFTIRNNAYYYPIVAIIVFFLSAWKWKVKLIGMALPFLFLLPFIIHTKTEAYKLTGVSQFSLFTGWQLANNALYIYDQIDVDSNSLATPEAKELNRISIEYFHHIDPHGYRDFLDTYVGNFFIREPEAPLKQYFSIHYKDLKTEKDLIRDWGRASVTFESFGKTLLLTHPIAYGQYFIWPNTKRYFLPPLSHLEQYNYGGNDIEPIAKRWFQYPTTKIHCISHRLQGFLIIYEALFLLFNLYFIMQIVLYVSKSHFLLIKEKTNSGYLLATAFLILNFAFSITATTNILRYQYVPMLLLLSFSLLLSDHLEKLALNKNKLKQIVPKTVKNEPLSVNSEPQL